MPAVLAASINRVPGAACTGRPSIVSVIGSAIKPLPCALNRYHVARVLIWARLAVEVILEFVPEFFDNRNRRHGGRVAQRAERAAQHILRNIPNQIDVIAGALAVVEPLQDLSQPGCALTARDAPAT